MKSRRLPSGLFVPSSPEEVAPWPEALRAYLEHGQKQIPVEIYAGSLGIGVLQDRPHTEVRWLDLQVDHGDLKGFRYIALGVPLGARTDDPFLRVIPYDGGEIILAVCEERVRFRDDPAFDQVVFRNDAPPDEARLTNTGRKPTKTQVRKLDQGQRLFDAVLQGRFTLRGRPDETRDAARARLLAATQRLRTRHMKLGRSSLMDALGLTSFEGVTALLRRAEWTREDLESR